MLVGNTLRSYPPVIAFVFLGQGMLLTFLFGQFTIGMELLYTLVAGVGLALGVRVEPDTGFLEHTEVMTPTVCKVGADNLSAFLVDCHLAL